MKKDICLIFSRPFTKYWSNSMKNNVSKYCDGIIISDFRGFGEIDIMNSIYLNFGGGANPEYYNIDEIIARCRYLRNIDKKIAFKLVNAAIISIESIFEDKKPKFFIGIPIDNYILNIINLVCMRRNVKRIFPVGSFLPNLTRWTYQGEWIQVRTPSQEEIKYYYDKINEKKFAPLTLKKHRGILKLVGLYLRERVKWLLFETLKFVMNDKYSFHYNTVYPSKGCITVRSIKNILSYKYFESKQLIDSKLLSDDFKIYLPLQFSPETTIDYYIDDYRFSDYYRLISDFIIGAPENSIIFIKEHPDLYGYRDLELYELTRSFANVFLCPVDMKTDEFITKCDLVAVTGAGSTGAEAAAKGKNVLSLGGAFYATDKVQQIKSFDDVKIWSKKFDFNNNMSLKDRNDVIKKILSNSLLGSCNFVRSTRKNREEINFNQNNIIHKLIPQ